MTRIDFPLSPLARITTTGKEAPPMIRRYEELLAWLRESPRTFEAYAADFHGGSKTLRTGRGEARRFEGGSGPIRRLFVLGLIRLAEPEPVNGEGLTLAEWLGAAGAFGWHGINPAGPYWHGQLTRAWEAGEDPTDWAAYLAGRAQVQLP